MIKLIWGMIIQSIGTALFYLIFDNLQVAGQQGITAAILVIIVIILSVVGSRSGNIIIASRIDIDED